MKEEIEAKKVEHEIAEESLSNSWKDEAIVIVFSLPIVVNFLTPMFSEMTMTQAWENLGKAPEWYQTIISVLVLVIFGLKKLVYKIADKLFDTSDKSGDCKCQK